MTDITDEGTGPEPIDPAELAAVVADDLPTVVIVGRPNVGKSTLFNRVVGGQHAIVEDRPGITRDRKIMEASWLEVPFNVVDTGGWMPGGAGTDLDAKVSRQVEEAVREADVVLFVVDASVGVTDDDQHIANWIRRVDPEVLIIANKADNDRREIDMWEFLSLGLGEPIPVSALHGRRAGDLLDVVVERFPEEARQRRDDFDVEVGEAWGDDDVAPPRIAIVGRPNVGKSTLFNRLVGGRRSIVKDEPGITRDRIDADGEIDGHAASVLEVAALGDLDARDEPLVDLVGPVGEPQRPGLDEEPGQRRVA